MRDIVFIRDGVDVDVVGNVVTGRWSGVLTEREVVQVVNQSGENGRFVGGKVESGNISFLCDRSGSVML